jgi:hypothetical protein
VRRTQGHPYRLGEPERVLAPARRRRRRAAAGGAARPVVTLRLSPQSGGAPLIRSYSLSGRPGGAEYRISVKQELQGAGSTYLHTHVGVGDTLDMAAPRGTTLRAGDTPVLLLSAGVGRRRYSPCSMRSPPSGPRGMCGGCTAHEMARRTRSRPRVARCSGSG